MKTVTLFLLSALGVLPLVSSAEQVVRFSDMKLLSSQTTNQLVYDESINLAANFGVNQNDKDLSGLFDENGKSPLCAPSNLAMFIAYQMGITKKLPINANVPGVSKDLQSLDLNALVTDLAQNECGTTPQSTSTIGFMNCLGSSFKNYFGVNVTVDRISANDSNARYPSYINRIIRAPDLQDIRDSIKKGDPVIVSVGWYSYNTNTQSWTRNGGHEMTVYGYSWETYFNDDSLSLAVMNPLTPWTNSTTNSDNDLIFAAKSYYSDKSYSIFFDANHFQGQIKRAFVEALNIIHLPTNR